MQVGDARPAGKGKTEPGRQQRGGPSNGACNMHQPLGHVQWSPWQASLSCGPASSRAAAARTHAKPALPTMQALPTHRQKRTPLRKPPPRYGTHQCRTSRCNHSAHREEGRHGRRAVVEVQAADRLQWRAQRLLGTFRATAHRQTAEIIINLHGKQRTCCSKSYTLRKTSARCRWLRWWLCGPPPASRCRSCMRAAAAANPSQHTVRSTCSCKQAGAGACGQGQRGDGCAQVRCRRRLPPLHRGHVRGRWTRLITLPPSADLLEGGGGPGSSARCAGQPLVEWLQAVLVHGPCRAIRANNELMGDCWRAFERPSGKCRACLEMQAPCCLSLARSRSRQAHRDRRWLDQAASCANARSPEKTAPTARQAAPHSSRAPARRAAGLGRMAAAMEAEIFGDGQQPGDELPEEFKTMSTEDIQRRWGAWESAGRRHAPGSSRRHRRRRRCPPARSPPAAFPTALAGRGCWRMRSVCCVMSPTA